MDEGEDELQIANWKSQSQKGDSNEGVELLSAARPRSVFVETAVVSGCGGVLYSGAKSGRIEYDDGDTPKQSNPAPIFLRRRGHAT